MPLYASVLGWTRICNAIPIFSSGSRDCPLLDPMTFLFCLHRHRLFVCLLLSSKEIFYSEFFNRILCNVIICHYTPNYLTIFNEKGLFIKLDV